MRTEYYVLLQHVGNNITVFSPGEGGGIWDPSGTYWGMTRTYRVVTDEFSETQELVPLGKAVRVTTEDMKQRFGERFEKA
jgi:hypothetical protein